MKKRNLLATAFVVTLLIYGFSVMLSGCKKPADGAVGPEGPAGADMNATCTQCHDLSTDMYVKIVQWENSVHATGGNFERSSTDCAPCHTHEGFVECLVTGATTTAASIDNPSPQNCRTCHNIHTNYDITDFDLATLAPVSLWINSTVVDIGKGNICVRCHQPRVPSPMPIVGDTSTYVIGSKYYGTHHGSQGAILAGTGGFEITGSLPYTNSYHTTGVTDGCIPCHMPATAYGDQAGAHTLNMMYDYHGSPKDYTAGCEAVGCHTTPFDFDYKGGQTEIDSLLTLLGDSLVSNGIMDTTDYIVPGSYTANQTGAFINYYMVLQDGSLGIHNLAYSRALLQNSIELF